MDTDRKIEQAIANGENNRRVMELIHNWCRHARVQKCGGTGLVGLETGLPIGHHAMACDHAAARGLATWDLADAALDFYDRNCAACTYRVPLRLPNLTSLVKERDEHQAHIEKERRVHEERATAERAARQAVRCALRAQLTALSATIVDHFDELDQGSSSDAHEKVLGIARLAPDTFTAAIVEHSFAMLENREGWFDETGLCLLSQLKADPVRLTRCALLSLGQYRSVGVAAAIVEANVSAIDTSLLAAALPALVGLANPERMPMSFERALVPRPLIAVHESHSSATETEIGKLLDQRDPYLVSCAARAIQVLAGQNKVVATRFARGLAAKLTRAKWLIDRRETGYSGDDPVIHELQEALTLAFEHSPNVTDVLLMQFAAGASGEGEVRIYKVYCLVLHDRNRSAQAQTSPRPETRVALKRLINAATIATNQDVLRELQSAFSYPPPELSALAREQIATLLGAAILMDDRVQRFDAEPPSGNDFLSRLERQNNRNLLVDLQAALIKWVAAAASGHPAATEQYIEILAGIPETSDHLRSNLIRNTHELMETPEGLNAVLPTLYTAMVGSCNRVRASAGRAVGKLNRRGREDVPVLLYEAFVALLFDPYVIVHQAAIDALERLELPDELTRRARAAVAGLINTYAVSHQDDRFLIECIELYLGRFATASEKRGSVGKILVALLDRMKSDVVAEKLRWLARDLREVEGFADLVLRVLADPRVQYRQEDILDALNELPGLAIQSRKSQIEAIATNASVAPDLPPSLIETLTCAGAWDVAARINETIYARIPDTTEQCQRKLAANLDRIATRFEEAIAQGKLDSLPELTAEWRTTEQQIEADRIQHAERHSPFPGFPRTH